MLKVLLRWSIKILVIIFAGCGVCGCRCAVYRTSTRSATERLWSTSGRLTITPTNIASVLSTEYCVDRRRRTEDCRWIRQCG